MYCEVLCFKYFLLQFLSYHVLVFKSLLMTSGTIVCLLFSEAWSISGISVTANWTSRKRINWSQTWPGTRQTSKMESFVTIARSRLLLSIVGKLSILDICVGSECASTGFLCEVFFFFFWWVGVWHFCELIILASSFPASVFFIPFAMFKIFMKVFHRRPWRCKVTWKIMDLVSCLVSTKRSHVIKPTAFSWRFVEVCTTF